MLKTYGEIRILDIEAENPADWPEEGAEHLRVSLPAGRFLGQMTSRGFHFGDRTLDAAIILARTGIDYARLVRLQPEISADHREIMDIALNSFPTDRRFHPAPEYDPVLAAKIIRAWVEDLAEFLLIRIKGRAAGFLALKALDDGRSAGIHLAAVAEEFRPAGVALSLYAAALLEAGRRGLAVIRGRVSTANPPVINLYAALGGTFSNPRDIFLKP